MEDRAEGGAARSTWSWSGEQLLVLWPRYVCVPFFVYVRYYSSTVLRYSRSGTQTKNIHKKILIKLQNIIMHDEPMKQEGITINNTTKTT
jgi:hypothetical protein